MKLCPNCEFIYEDDQRICDMDGEALVEDTRVGVFPGTVPTKTGSRTTKSRARMLVVPAVAGLALSVLLSLVYYASSAPLDSKFESTGLKSGAAETNPQQRNAPPLDKPSPQPAIDPSQSPANQEAASESVNTAAEELAKIRATESARSAVVLNANESNVKAGENSLEISRRLRPRPGLTPLPRLSPLKRLPAAKPEPSTPGSTTLKKQLLNQKSAASNRKASVVEVKPDRDDASKRSKVGSFLKKTGRLLKKPFQL